MAAAATLRRSSISSYSRLPPSPPLQTNPPSKISLSSNLKLPKLTINPLPRRLRTVARMADTAAGRYATALADLAKSTNTLDQTSADVEKLESLFADQQILDFFTNPTIDDEQKRGIADEISQSSNLQAHVANFLKVLVDSKRIELMKEIAREFEAAYNRITGTEVAVVTSVVALERRHLSQIAKGVQKLTRARNVRIKTAIDASLVAGFTIRYGISGSKLIDMSVRKQLQDIAGKIDVGEIQLGL